MKMKTTLAKRVMLMIFIPFLIIFGILSALIFSMVSNFMNSGIQVEIKGITEINATALAGRVDSVRISVLTAAELVENIDPGLENARNQAGTIVRSILLNEYVYNAWLAFEPDLFDGKDSGHKNDYPGAPSGRFMMSYVVEDGEIVIAPDMDEEEIDDPEESQWYTTARDTGRMYIDTDLDGTNVWDYGVDGEMVYTLSVVMPVYRDGIVIGCVGADMIFDEVTLSISGEYEMSVAVFYSSGRVFYAPDLKYAEESIETLDFSRQNMGRIRRAFENTETLTLDDEYCIFNNTRSFTVFEPVRINNYEGSGLFLYVAAPRTVLSDRLSPVLLMLAVTITAVFAGLMFLLLYVVRRVSKPLNQLTLAADAISQGDIETEIGYFPDADGEIELMSQSLHRMVEQFRAHATSLEQAHREMSIKSEIEKLTAVSAGMNETFGSLTKMLREYFQIIRTTIVTSGSNKDAAFSNTGDKDSDGMIYNYLYFDKIEAVMADRKIAYLNSAAIEAYNINFLDSRTKAVYFVPLANENGFVFGCLIFEDDGEKLTLSGGIESIMIYVAEIVGKWLYDKQWEPETAAQPEPEEIKPEPPSPPEIPEISEITEAPAGAVERLKEIEGLEVDAAVESVGGLQDVYEQTVRLTVRLLPETTDKMDIYINGGDYKKFGVEVHGLKSVMRSIGASELGSMAANLEDAVHKGDIDYCEAEYPGFRELLLSFAEKINAALDAGSDENGQEEKQGIDKDGFMAELQKIKEAAEGYDSMEALEISRNLLNYNYNAETAELLKKVIFSLEEFNCEEALLNIKNIENIET